MFFCRIHPLSRETILKWPPSIPISHISHLRQAVSLSDISLPSDKSVSIECKSHDASSIYQWNFFLDVWLTGMMSNIHLSMRCATDKPERKASILWFIRKTYPCPGGLTLVVFLITLYSSHVNASIQLKHNWSFKNLQAKLLYSTCPLVVYLIPYLNDSINLPCKCNLGIVITTQILQVLIQFRF